MSYLHEVYDLGSKTLSKIILRTKKETLDRIESQGIEQGD